MPASAPAGACRRKAPRAAPKTAVTAGIGPRSVSAEPGLVSQYTPTSLPSRQAGGPRPGPGVVGRLRVLGHPAVRNRGTAGLSVQ